MDNIQETDIKLSNIKIPKQPLFIRMIVILICCISIIICGYFLIRIIMIKPIICKVVLSTNAFEVKKNHYSRNHSITSNHWVETISVAQIDSLGNIIEGDIPEIRIKRVFKDNLPKKGDTIKIYLKDNNAYEYSLINIYFNLMFPVLVIFISIIVIIFETIEYKKE